MISYLSEFLLSNTHKSSGRLISVSIGIVLAIGFIIDLAINHSANIDLATVIAGYGIALYGASKGLDTIKFNRESNVDKTAD